MFIAALYVLFVINCLFLILVVLLQAGKGDGLAILGAGGGGGDTILGNRGAATFLSKLTVVSAVLFMVLSVVLAYDASKTETRVGRGIVDPNLELSENAGLLALDEDEEGLTVEETEAVEPESSDEENADEPAAVDTETATSASTEEGEAAASPEDTPEPDSPTGGSE